MRTVIVLVALLLAGCGGASGGGGAIRVVASTNVYGDIARQLGGERVDVTSILSDPQADPHLYEPGTRNGLAVARADVLVENGAGYDTFMQKLADASPRDGRLLVDVADVLGAPADANPHFWYDLPRMPRVAAAIADAFERLDPLHATGYRARLRTFTDSVDALRQIAVPRRPVAYTEPVPAYLLTALHVPNLAPAGFTSAIENGVEPPPAAVADMDALLRGRRVAALLYNSQAVSPITRRVRATALSAGIPVVPVTETLPPGRTYQQWLRSELHALQRATG